MNTTKTKKSTGLLALTVAATSLLAWLTPESYYQAALDNAFTRELKQKLVAYTTALPEDRVYMQTDKPLYQPGDDIWISAFVRDGITLKPSQKSDIVHIELINPKGSVEKKISVIAKNGIAAGDFNLDQEIPGGQYKLKAYTNWMKNEGEQNCFEKEITVQDVVLPALKMKLDFEKKAFGAGDEVIAKLELNTNENKPLADHKIKFVVNLNGEKLLEQSDLTDNEGLKYLKFNLPQKLKSNDGLLNVMIDYNGNTESVSRSIPIVLNNIKLDLLPEGGDLVYGLESQVAFKALNEFGKPADIEGVVETEKGSRVATFSSFHQGMGSFRINPQAGERYIVKITRPEGIQQTYKLPEALERGFVMQVDNSRKDEVAVTVQSTEKEQLALVAQMRSQIYYTTLIDVVPGTTKFSFPTSEFPAGVSQVTLFDEQGIPRCERLVFLNKNRQLRVSIESDKEKYLPREKVKLTLQVKDERGMPSPAHLSMAVVNDQLLSFADDKQGNILSQLLLQQDLEGKVEEPAFYFDPKENKSDKALDYLLLTQGWRRFTWEKIMEAERPQLMFPAQRAVVAGQLMDANTGKALENVDITLPNGKQITTDAEGKFSLKYLDLSSPVTLQFKKNGFYPQSQYLSDYNEHLYVYMYHNDYNYQQARRSKARMPAGAPPQDIVLVDAIPESESAREEGVRMEMAPVLNKAVMKDLKKAKPSGKGAQLAAGEVKAVASKADRDDVASKKKEKLVVGDLRFAREKNAEDMEMPAVQRNVYYRARVFNAPAYNKQENVENRTDFRNTIYWNPDIEVGFSGKKTIEFFTSDDITSFKTTVEGVGHDGSIGRMEKNFFTQLPFAMSTKIPVEVATEDIVSIPLTLKNNTNGPLGGVISVIAPDGLESLVKLNPVQTIMPGAAKTIYLDYKVLNRLGYGEFTIGFKACGLSDAFVQKIKIAPKGFPVKASFSGQETDREYTFTVDKLVNGSLKASFTAFPNVVSDLMKGVEGILQEPYGCFEQTSCTAYPNAMVLDYLRTTENKDTKVMARATDLLDRGYKRLTTFETKNKGYEWFGASPAHEGLTAYGIMEFSDMQKAGGVVDKQMLNRTAMWLLSKKDGKGGFQREQHAYHDFGRISDEVMNAYIVYALTEAGYTDLEKEFEHSFKKAMDSKDAYILAMMAGAAMNLNKKQKSTEAMAALLKLQAKDGSFTGSSHSITYSQGQSLTIETTALAILAQLKSQEKDMNALSNSVKFLTSSRSGSGVFSSTQGTILSLKALTEFAKFSKRTTEDGTILVYVDGKRVREMSYKAGDKGAIVMDSLEKFITGEGKHTIRVKYQGVKNPLPYSVAVNWNTSLPKSDSECTIDLKTQLASSQALVGETVRLKATISNKKNTDVPSTMAIIGIPAGLTAQPWQLKELQEKGLFDYYEIKGNNIAFYYRGMAPKAVKEINLDLKAEMPGEYEAPASSAYLYYTNEFKTWTSTDKIVIKKANS